MKEPEYVQLHTQVLFLMALCDCLFFTVNPENSKNFPPEESDDRRCQVVTVSSSVDEL